MIDNSKINNIITIAEFSANKYTFNDLKQISKLIHNGYCLNDFESCNILGKFKNLVMNTRLEEVNNYIFDNANKLLITNNTTNPVGDETTPTSGIIYTASCQLMTNRVRGNPYYLNWAIMSDNANGPWGSLVWTDSNNLIINRVLTPNVVKTSNKVMFVELQSTITS